MTEVTPIYCPSSPQECDGTLLGGRVRYTQFLHGYRTGLEPVLLAAALPIARGDSVLEAGCGAGAGLLCAHERAGELHGVGLEHDAETVSLANRNFVANGAEHLQAVQVHLPNIPKTLRDHARNANGRFGHVMANPPWNQPTGMPSPDRRRRLALHAEHTTPESWIAALTRWVLPRGSLTFILPAGAVDRSCAALRARDCGSIQLYPLWPKADREAKLVIVSAIHGGRAPSRLRAGMVLHHDDGRFTEAAESVLRAGRALPNLF